jgi:signal transduction histidine kinase/AraC-like DNA-binding protein
MIPEKIQYAYMLEGFEEEWNYVGNNHSVTYTNLDPGKYIFKVKSSNSSGLWLGKEQSLGIIILPPWYRTFWAYSVYFILLLLGILLFRRSVVARTTLQHKLALKETEKEKLDELHKMKTRFFTNISHEFRTPLTLIINPLENLLSDINILPAMKQQLSIIQVNARRLLRLINQLLDISKIENDHLDLKVSNGDIVYFIRDISTLFRWPASQRNIDIVFSSERDTFNGYFDGDKIEKICYNLISNALKYTPEGGRIVIEVIVGNEMNGIPNGFISLSIKDSGVGISKEEQTRIFEHFYRSDKIKNLDKSGFGIGLAIVYGLVKACHGTIEIDSREGIGTEFNITLPVSEENFNEDEIECIEKDEKAISLDVYDLEHGTNLFTDKNFGDEVVITDKQDKKKNLLLVEDDKDLRSHLKSQFSEYRIIEAENGKQALESIIEFTPDLIISDIRMPEMDGLELCKRIKEDENTSHIPFILLTAKATVKDECEGLSYGADAYITKPFDTKILQTTVDNLIESRSQLKEKYSKSIALEPSDISITSVDEKFLNKAIAIAEAHIADPDYSVDMFSKEIGMSRSHLHRKFVGLTGLSPSGFIRTLRMKRAAQLLIKGQLTVSEILYEVGIKSRSYFIKSFKEQFGMSPTDFAESNRQNNRVADTD